MNDRRFLLRMSAVLAAAVVAVSSCTSGANETTTMATTTTRPTTTTTTLATTTTEGLKYPVGGDVVISHFQEPTTLNTFLPGGDSEINDLLSQAYATGVQDVDGDTLELVPELVTELPTIENGGVVINVDSTMTVTYTIRDDAQWSDGVPITGEDFQFTLETILNPDYPISKLYYDQIIETSVGEKTFEYTMAVPSVQYEVMFSEILPKHDVEGTDFLTDWNTTRWVSGGPFVFDEWTSGESIQLVRNPNYWKTDPETEQQLPFLDSVRFEFIEDDQEAIAAFTDRDTDIIAPDNTTDEGIDALLGSIAALRDLESDGAVIEVVDGPVWEHLNFQFGPGREERNPNSCTDLLDMRLAVAYAVDRTALTEAIFNGEVEPMGSYVEAFTPALSGDQWSAIEPDPVKANQYYQSAVAKSGKECSVVFTTSDDRREQVRLAVADLLAPMFEAAGIPYTSELESAQTFYGDTLSAGTWDVAEWAWRGSPGFTGLILLHDVFDPDGELPNGSNYYRWGTSDSSVIDASTERFAEIHDELNSTVDERELTDLVSEAEQILFDDMVIIPLFSIPVAAGVWGDEIARFENNASSSGFTWNIEMWYRADAEG